MLSNSLHLIILEREDTKDGKCRTQKIGSEGTIC